MSTSGDSDELQLLMIFRLSDDVNFWQLASDGLQNLLVFRLCLAT